MHEQYRLRFQKDSEISSLGVVMSGKHDLGAYTEANRALERLA